MMGSLLVHAETQHTCYTANIDMGQTLDQNQSILFSKLPSEARTLVFQYALASFDDFRKPYRPDRVYFRPGYHFHQATDYSLLLTCKRVFEETRYMPVSEAEHNFWMFKGPWKIIHATSRHKWPTWKQWWRQLSATQQQAVRFVHVSIQQYYLESLGTAVTLPSFTFRTRHLKISICRSDWWSWESPVESADQLGICPWRPGRTSSQLMLMEPLHPDLNLLRTTMDASTWGWQIRQMHGLETLRMEFETLMDKKQQMLLVVERARWWRFPMLDNQSILEPVGRSAESEWTGVDNSQTDPVHNLRSTMPETPIEAGERCRYYVVELMWNSQKLQH